MSYCAISKNDALRRQLDSLDKQQLEILIKSYIYGEEEGFGHELVVIAWKESNFGKYPMNLEDGRYGSFGPYHVLLEHSMKRHKMHGTWNKSRLAERHLSDVEFSAKDALTVWKAFYIRNKNTSNQSYRTFAMYNAGVAGIKNAAGKKYADDANQRLLVLKDWIIKNDIINRVIEPARRVIASSPKHSAKEYRDLKTLRIPIKKE